MYIYVYTYIYIYIAFVRCGPSRTVRSVGCSGLGFDWFSEALTNIEPTRYVQT